jgi:hypothetical protein
VETSGDSLEGGDIAKDTEVWPLTANDRSVTMVEEVPGQILQRVVSTLTRRPVIVKARRRDQGVEGGEEGLTGNRCHPSVDPDHSAHADRCRDASHPQLPAFVESGSGPVDRLTPVVEETPGVRVGEPFDGFHDGLLCASEFIRDGSRGLEQTMSLIG